MKPSRRAFSLLEILIVTAIIVAVGAGLLISGARRLEFAAIQAEDSRLEQISADILRSLDSEDYASTNLLALAGVVPGGVTPTAFSLFTSTAGFTASADQWFSKVARVRGLNVTYGAAVSASAQPELYKIAFNPVGQPRLLFLGPTTETDKQRMVLVSLMSRPEKQQMPAYQASAAWFDSIFGTNWATSSQTLPSLWTTLLTAAQQADWVGTPSAGSTLWRLRTLNLTVPKHLVSISNGHPTLSLTVTTDGGATAYTATSGQVVTTNPVIDGRNVVVTQGGTATPLRVFAIRKKSSVIVE